MIIIENEENDIVMTIQIQSISDIISSFSMFSVLYMWIFCSNDPMIDAGISMLSL